MWALSTALNLLWHNQSMSQKISNDSNGMTVTKESSFISPLNSPSTLTKSNYVLHLSVFIITVHCHVIWDFLIFTLFKKLETQALHLSPFIMAWKKTHLSKAQKQKRHILVLQIKNMCKRAIVKDKLTKQTSPTNKVHHGLPLPQSEYASWEYQVIFSFRDAFKA